MTTGVRSGGAVSHTPEREPGVGRVARTDERLTRRLTVRMSEAEFRSVRAAAELEGLSPSGWLRELAARAEADQGAGAVGLREVLWLHADVVALRRGADMPVEQVAALLARLDELVDRLQRDTRPTGGASRRRRW